jgi:hypothetical protein
VESHQTRLFDHALQHSLRRIQAAQARFRLLTSSPTTQAVLASQIEICDVLLDEIRAVSCSLERRMSSRGMIRRRSAVARRNRGRRLGATRSKPANPSKQRD